MHDAKVQAFYATIRSIGQKPAFTPYYALNAAERSRLVYLIEMTFTDGYSLPSGTAVQVLLP